MLAMRIVHTADVHLRGEREERWKALDAVLAVAADAGAGVVAIAGDLFDRDVDAPALKTNLRRALERFPGTVVIIPGNHDARGIRAGDFFGDNVRVLAGHDTVADVGGIRFVGLPYEDVSIDGTLARLRAASRQRADGTNVLLYHGELLDFSPGGGAFGDEDDREYMPARIADIASLGFDYVLAGHFHKNHHVRACGDGYFVYSGSPVAITRRETGRRHVTLLDPGAAPVAHVLNTHHFEEVDIRLAPSEGEHPLVRIEKRLSTLDMHARALVTVRGFVDLSQVGMTEVEFQAALKELCARFPCESVETGSCNDVGAIIAGDLFKRFDARLERTALGEDDRALVREMTIRAMMEVPDAR